MVLTSTLLTLLCVEGLAEWAWRQKPGSEWLHRAQVDYYLERERRVVQFLPGVAQYDPKLSYRLRPGVHAFSNREFATTISVNSAGLRDDEKSLVAPEVIVLGDSFAMGWGVEDNQAFPQVLEAMTGLRTLNTGVPSYGTAREMLLLETLDRSRLRYLIIQYCSNDDEENHTFMQNDYHLPVMSRDEYDGISASHVSGLSYYPMKRTFTFLPYLLKHRNRLGTRQEFPPDVRASADLAARATTFLRVVAHTLDRMNGGGIRVIVLDMEDPYSMTNLFVEQVARQVAEGQEPSLRGRLFLVRPLLVLGLDDFYPTDTHLKASGHAKVARMLSESIRLLESGDHPSPLSGSPDGGGG